MKVVITKQKNLEDPHLELDINLTKGATSISLTYTCPNCAGYGCRHGSGPCDDSLELAPKDVISTLGESARPMLEKLFKQILNQ